MVEYKAHLHAESFVDNERRRFRPAAEEFEDKARQVAASEVAATKAVAQQEIRRPNEEARNEMRSAQQQNLEREFWNRQSIAEDAASAVERARAAISEEASEAIQFQNAEHQSAYNNLFREAQASIENQTEELQAMVVRLETAESQSQSVEAQQELHQQNLMRENIMLHQSLARNESNQAAGSHEAFNNNLIQELLMSQKRNEERHEMMLAEMKEKVSIIQAEMLSQQDTHRYEMGQMQSINDAKEESLRNFENIVQSLQDQPIPRQLAMNGERGDFSFSGNPPGLQTPPRVTTLASAKADSPSFWDDAQSNPGSNSSQRLGNQTSAPQTEAPQGDLRVSQGNGGKTVAANLASSHGAQQPQPQSSWKSAVNEWMMFNNERSKTTSQRSKRWAGTWALSLR